MGDAPGGVTRIRVDTLAPYDVIVGRGVLRELPGILGSDVRRVGVIHPQALAATASSVCTELSASGFEVHPIEVPNAEQAKTAAVLDRCWKALGKAGFTRSDAIVGVGGGATTDLAGFVAATFLRGLTVVHVPTTLLGMVDAAVGGKTGINTAEGKNLVGAFHEPAAVLCDLTALETLDREDMVSGLAEVVKCGLIADLDILSIIEAHPTGAVDPKSTTSRDLIERGIRVKARVVAGDLTEGTSTGRQVGREALNYGHTLGHAIERAEHYRFRHGTAVAIGMVYAAELARLSGRLDESVVTRHRSVLAAVGLPTSYGGAAWSVLHDAMKVDKKTRGDRLRFVILEKLGRTAMLEGPDPALLSAAFAEVSG